MKNLQSTYFVITTLKLYFKKGFKWTFSKRGEGEYREVGAVGGGVYYWEGYFGGEGEGVCEGCIGLKGLIRWIEYSLEPRLPAYVVL